MCTLSRDLCIDLPFEPECEEREGKEGREGAKDRGIKGILREGKWGGRERKEDSTGEGGLQSATVFT